MILHGMSENMSLFLGTFVKTLSCEKKIRPFSLLHPLYIQSKGNWTSCVLLVVYSDDFTWNIRKYEFIFRGVRKIVKSDF